MSHSNVVDGTALVVLEKRDLISLDFLEQIYPGIKNWVDSFKNEHNKSINEFIEQVHCSTESRSITAIPTLVVIMYYIIHRTNSKVKSVNLKYWVLFFVYYDTVMFITDNLQKTNKNRMLALRQSLPLLPIKNSWNILLNLVFQKDLW